MARSIICLLLALVAACAAEQQLTASNWGELVAANNRGAVQTKYNITLTPNFSMEGYDGKPLCLACIAKNADVTIIGNGAVLDVKNGGNIITIGTSTTATIHGVTFKRGFAGGGAISSKAYLLTLQECTFQGNQAYGHQAEGTGGAIQHVSVFPDYDYVSLNIYACNFVNNTAYWGGAIHLWSTKAVISNSVFQRNAAGANGGGIFLHKSEIHVDDSHFIGNKAYTGADGRPPYGGATWGGAIHLQSNSKAFLSMNEFVGKKSDGPGLNDVATAWYDGPGRGPSHTGIRADGSCEIVFVCPKNSKGPTVTFSGDNSTDLTTSQLPPCATMPAPGRGGCVPNNLRSKPNACPMDQQCGPKLCCSLQQDCTSEWFDYRCVDKMLS